MTLGDKDTDIEGASANIEVVNDRVQVGPNDDLQSKIDDAGVNGIVVWEEGTFSVGTPLTPSNNQTWFCGRGTEFRPSGDNIVFDFSSATDVEVHGTLTVRDPNSNQTSAEAIKLDETVGCYFNRIRLHNIWNGIRTFASSDGTKENVINSIYSTSTRNRGVWLGGQTHDNHFNSVWIAGAGSSDHGFLVDTSGVDGGNMVSQIICISMGNDGFQVANLNREFWIGQGIFDSCSSHGFNHFAGGCRAFFIGTLWASGNSATGVRISGTSGSKVNEGQLGQLYAIGNSSEGVILEHTDGMALGRVHCEDNDDGLVLANGQSDNFYCGYLRASSNTNFALDGASAGSETHVGRVVTSGTIQNGGNFTTINGGPRTTYTPSNVTTDRSFDANSTTTAELADVLGTLIADLQTAGLIQ